MHPTKPTVHSYIDTLSPSRNAQIQTLIEWMKSITSVTPKMWGTMIGYGHVTYQYASGHQGEMPIFAFAPRQKALTFYLNCDVSSYDVSKLGPSTQGVGCLYLKNLDQVDPEAFKALAQKVIRDVTALDVIQTVIEPVQLFDEEAAQSP